MYLEHANITVNNINRTIDFFKTAFPDFELRGEGVSQGSRWVHFGNDVTYLALNEETNKSPVLHDYTRTGINHLGFVVDDIEAIGQRLISSGYKRSYAKTVQKYRIRDYFFDSDGNEFEFIEYLSEKMEERNDYSD